MTMSVAELERLLRADSEFENLEFKEAKHTFDSRRLAHYVSGLANDGGGTLILGVADELPRRIVGSTAWDEAGLVRKREDLYEQTGIRVRTEIVDHPDGPLIVFHVPERQAGRLVRVDDVAYTRVGSQLRRMSEDEMSAVYRELAGDFSAGICDGASIEDLEPVAVAAFRSAWVDYSGETRLAQLTDEQLLHDAELIDRRGITNAAMILFGAKRSLGRLGLGQCEIIFEYRGNPAHIDPEDSIHSRAGFFSFYRAIWDRINLRNETHYYQSGLVRKQVKSFSEQVVREALLNAVSHRDYTRQDPVHVRQYPNRIAITSPGGLPTGITTENILWKHSPRNRRLAEAFKLCGLVEKAGQGMDRMFAQCIREGKPAPDLSGTDASSVSISIEGNIQDESFLRFLETVTDEARVDLGDYDVLMLERLRRGERVPDELKHRLPQFCELGVVERTGTGRGTRYILSRQYYDFIGEPGKYTRARGPTSDACKAVLLGHIGRNALGGSPLSDLADALSGLRSRREVRTLLQEMRHDGLIQCRGAGRTARWYPVPPPG